MYGWLRKVTMALPAVEACLCAAPPTGQELMQQQDSSGESRSWQGRGWRCEAYGCKRNLDGYRACKHCRAG
eukprot:8595102-Pyramimonas_sp.AAC.1